MKNYQYLTLMTSPNNKQSYQPSQNTQRCKKVILELILYQHNAQRLL